MKPKTKLQVRVVNLSNNLPKISDEIKQWAYDHCLMHKGTLLKNGRASCLDCGHQWHEDHRLAALILDEGCPSCGTKIKIEETRKQKFFDSAYFTVIETVEEFQVIRLFKVSGQYKAGKKASLYCFSLSQIWMLPNGKFEIVGHNRCGGYYGWSDTWNGDWTLRTRQHIRSHDMYPYKIYPKKGVQDIYKKHGYRGGFYMISPYTFLSNIIKDNTAETLLKVNQIPMLKWYLQDYNRSSISSLWPSIRICIRNNYTIPDASIWKDYINLLEYFGKDLRNAKYVCPENLRREHDRLVDKKRALQQKRKQERQRLEAINAMKSYKREKGKYFGLEFSNENITIRVLSSVQEFIEEGDHHKHCLFTNNYHKKPDSLCLSALVNGQRMETIEVSLSKLKVIQARGKRNQSSKYHEEIVSLMKKNMRFIKAIRDAKPKKKAIKRESSLTKLLAS